MTAIAWTGAFAMYDASGQLMDANDAAPGLLADVTGSIDEAAGTFSLASTNTFFGLLWSTSGGTLYGPGTYTVNVNGDGSNALTGDGNVTFTVGAGQLGGNINFSWSVNSGIDVFLVWDVSTVGGITTYTSVDTNADVETVVPGTQMVDGPFPNFSANFDMEHPEVVVQVPVDVLSPVDFDDDGSSDILWRDGTTGANTIWLDADMTTQQAVDTVATGWKVAGIADFDGNGMSDIFWRNANTGQNVLWGDGDSANKVVLGTVATGWKVAGVGDFDQNGLSDILWRNSTTGQNVIWSDGDSASKVALPPLVNLNWKVAGIGDFDGSGTSDILWRNSTTGQNVIWGDGDSANKTALTAVATTWKVAGIGDFDGSGTSDILWRNTSSGQNVIWGDGNSANKTAVTTLTNPNWQVAGVGDYNGTGESDILWRNSNTGANTIWNGGNSADVLPLDNVGTDWTVPAQTGTWLADGAFPV